MVQQPENYWYVQMIGDSFCIDDENMEKLVNATEPKLIEITDMLGGTVYVHPAMIISIAESTPALRDASYEWNKRVDEEVIDRKKRLGTAVDFDE